jgi:mycothiol synthase
MPDLDTALWSVAWDGDEVVGSVQGMIWKTENETLSVRRGWLERISVRRPWRRNGVARALIVDALRRLRDADMDEAMLGVDSQNPTGALQLYESLGFEVKDRGTTYRKDW